MEIRRFEEKDAEVIADLVAYTFRVTNSRVDYGVQILSKVRVHIQKRGDDAGRRRVHTFREASFMHDSSEAATHAKRKKNAAIFMRIPKGIDSLWRSPEVAPLDANRLQAVCTAVGETLFFRLN